MFKQFSIPTAFFFNFKKRFLLFEIKINAVFNNSVRKQKKKQETNYISHTIYHMHDLVLKYTTFKNN